MTKERTEKDKRFAVYNERKLNRKYSLWTASREGFLFCMLMLAAVILPVTLIYLNADKLGVWWWILLILYSAFLSVSIYIIYRYREIVEIRSCFTKEEFERKFAKEMWLISFMDKFHPLFH